MNFFIILKLYFFYLNRETVFVDVNRHEPLTVEDMNTHAILNVCIDGLHIAEDVVPLELMVWILLVFESIHDGIK